MGIMHAIATEAGEPEARRQPSYAGMAAYRLPAVSPVGLSTFQAVQRINSYLR
jgi:hypothetical protein